MVGRKLEALMALQPIETAHRFDRRDTILYALGIGCGLGGDIGADELRYVLEDRLVAFPTMATVLAYPGFWFDRAELGLEWRRILLQAQYLTLERPLPIEGEVVGVTRVVGARDRGEGRGALIAVERQIHERAGGQRIATATSLIALRGDGEREGVAGRMPDRLPPCEDDGTGSTCTVPTMIGQPLIYRLSGDHNPLHSDPAVARQAGFDRPIMHGLGSFGIVARAVVARVCADGARLRAIGAALSAPVMPGDGVTVRRSALRGGTLRFDAASGGRTVLSAGSAEFG